MLPLRQGTKGTQKQMQKKRNLCPFALGRFNWAGLYQLGVYGVDVGRELPRR